MTPRLELVEELRQDHPLGVSVEVTLRVFEEVVHVGVVVAALAAQHQRVRERVIHCACDRPDVWTFFDRHILAAECYAGIVRDREPRRDRVADGLRYIRVLAA